MWSPSHQKTGDLLARPSESSGKASIGPLANKGDTSSWMTMRAPAHLPARPHIQKQKPQQLAAGACTLGDVHAYSAKGSGLAAGTA